MASDATGTPPEGTAGAAVLAIRMTGGDRVVATLAGDHVVVGRGDAADLRLEDREVSRVHAELRRVGDVWLLGDAGLSRNGTYVNGTRIAGPRRLRDGDVLRLGTTSLVYREAGPDPSPSTQTGSRARAAGLVTPAQRRVLGALCAPAGPGRADVASNAQIARDLTITVDTVKSHLRTLFILFGLDGVPANQKRLRLATLAREWGLDSASAAPAEERPTLTGDRTGG